MNTRNENENKSEPHETRPAPKGAEPFEAEAESPREAQEPRETVEGGYGWGV